jgi:hypothetical protein
MGLFRTELKKPVEAVNSIVNDRKTYILVIVCLAVGIADGAGYIEIPEWFLWVLGPLGFGTIRHAIGKGQKAAKDAIEKAGKK